MRGYRSFGTDPHPGHLNKRIKIGYTDNEINENGFPTPVDHIIAECWAAPEDAGDQNFRAADTTNAEQVVNFTIRYREGILPGMWVKFHGEKYTISDIGHFMFKRQYLGLKASITKGVG